MQIFLRLEGFPALTVTLDRKEPVTLEKIKLSLPYRFSYFFHHNGKVLPDSTLLPDPKIPPLSTLTITQRLIGGGGDGGATGAESRDCYLNMYAEKKPDKIDPYEQRLSKWVNCALSNETLTSPCVIDNLGNVFNKESLVEALITKRLPKQFRHIKGLKDMIDVNLEPMKGKGSDDYVKFQCPITGLEFNGRYKFFALRKCGHVLSSKAVKEVKSSSCLVCHKEFEERDKIVINGDEDEVAELMKRMEERVKCKDKKATKGKTVEVGELVAIRDDAVEGNTNGKRESVVEVKGVISGKGRLQSSRKQDALRGTNAAPAKRFKAVDVAPAHANKEVYASIFNSSNKKTEIKETYMCRSLPIGRN